MKKINILVLGVLFILFTGCIGIDNAIVRGYYDKAEYYDSEGFQDYTDYCKYYYNEEYDEKFSENKLYSLVNEENISDIVNIFRDFRQQMSLSNRYDEYDFDDNVITSDDYVYIKAKEYDSDFEEYINYTVYFYDTAEHTLYYIHSNI